MKKYRAFVSWGPLAAAVLLIAVSACSPSQPSSPGGRAQPESSAPAPELDDSYTAEVDPSTGIVRLPITVALGLPGEGIEVDGQGSDAYVAQCLTEAGYPHIVEPGREQRTAEWYYFGPWVEENVVEWGYVGPPGPGGDRSRTYDPVQPVNAQSEADGWLDARADCSAQYLEQVGRESDVLATLPAELRTAWAESVTYAESTHTFTQVHHEWAACVENQGLAVVDEYTGGGWIEGVDVNTLSEENIRVAVIDVRCRTQVNYMQRILDQAAAYEGPYVTRYEAELAAAAKDIAAIAEKKKTLSVP